MLPNPFQPHAPLTIFTIIFFIYFLFNLPSSTQGFPTSTATPRPGSADSRGLRPHAPTLEERWALNFPGAKERIVPEKLRTYKPCANVCATAPGLRVVSFFGTYPNFPIRKFVRVTLQPQNIATGTTWTPADRFSTKNGLPNDPKSSSGAPKMCSVELRGRFCEPLGDPFGPRRVHITRSFIFPS